MGNPNVPQGDVEKIDLKELKMGMLVQTIDGQFAGEITQVDSTSFYIQWTVMHGKEARPKGPIGYDFDAMTFEFVQQH